MKNFVQRIGRRKYSKKKSRNGEKSQQRAIIEWYIYSIQYIQAYLYNDDIMCKKEIIKK
jgi:hypothetical protein